MMLVVACATLDEGLDSGHFVCIDSSGHSKQKSVKYGIRSEHQHEDSLLQLGPGAFV